MELMTFIQIVCGQRFEAFGELVEAIGETPHKIYADALYAQACKRFDRWVKRNQAAKFWTALPLALFAIGLFIGALTVKNDYYSGDMFWPLIIGAALSAGASALCSNYFDKCVGRGGAQISGVFLLELHRIAIAANGGKTAPMIDNFFNPLSGFMARCYSEIGGM